MLFLFFFWSNYLSERSIVFDIFVPIQSLFRKSSEDHRCSWKHRGWIRVAFSRWFIILCTQRECNGTRGLRHIARQFADDLVDFESPGLRATRRVQIS